MALAQPEAKKAKIMPKYYAEEPKEPARQTLTDVGVIMAATEDVCFVMCYVPLDHASWKPVLAHVDELLASGTTTQQIDFMNCLELYVADGKDNTKGGVLKRLISKDDRRSWTHIDVWPSSFPRLNNAQVRVFSSFD